MQSKQAEEFNSRLVAVIRVEFQQAFQAPQIKHTPFKTLPQRIKP